MCNACESKFTRKDSLKTHQDTLHKEIKFKCNECNNQFSKKGHLKTHQNSEHGGINECAYQANQKGHLITHKDSVHEVIKYNCNKCDKLFTIRSRLKSHQNSVH